MLRCPPVRSVSCPGEWLYLLLTCNPMLGIPNQLRCACACTTCVQALLAAEEAGREVCVLYCMLVVMWLLVLCVQTLLCSMVVMTVVTIMKRFRNVCVQLATASCLPERLGETVWSAATLYTMRHAAKTGGCAENVTMLCCFVPRQADLFRCCVCDTATVVQSLPAVTEEVLRKKFGRSNSHVLTSCTAVF